ncbi:hypothetical protein B0H11DRAFT_2018060, partial [Mycena galericulata]
MPQQSITTPPQSTSSRTHRLSRGTIVYAAGFVVTHEQMVAMAHAACDDKFLKRYRSLPVFALKWHVSRYNYEILDGDSPRTYLFAVHFFPWRGNELKDAPALTDEQRKAWLERYGQHTASETYEERTAPYPTDGAVADFLEQCIQEVIADHNLWHFLEPAFPRMLSLQRAHMCQC